MSHLIPPSGSQRSSPQGRVLDVAKLLQKYAGTSSPGTAGTTAAARDAGVRASALHQESPGVISCTSNAGVDSATLPQPPPSSPPSVTSEALQSAGAASSLMSLLRAGLSDTALPNTVSTRYGIGTMASKDVVNLPWGRAFIGERGYSSSREDVLKSHLHTLSSVFQVLVESLPRLQPTSDSRERGGTLEGFESSDESEGGLMPAPAIQGMGGVRMLTMWLEEAICSPFNSPRELLLETAVLLSGLIRTRSELLRLQGVAQDPQLEAERLAADAVRIHLGLLERLASKPAQCTTPGLGRLATACRQWREVILELVPEASGRGGPAEQRTDPLRPGAKSEDPRSGPQLLPSTSSSQLPLGPAPVVVTSWTTMSRVLRFQTPAIPVAPVAVAVAPPVHHYVPVVMQSDPVGLYSSSSTATIPRVCAASVSTLVTPAPVSVPLAAPVSTTYVASPVLRYVSTGPPTLASVSSVRALTPMISRTPSATWVSTSVLRAMTPTGNRPSVRDLTSPGRERPLAECRSQPIIGLGEVPPAPIPMGFSRYPSSARPLGSLPSTEESVALEPETQEQAVRQESAKLGAELARAAKLSEQAAACEAALAEVKDRQRRSERAAQNKRSPKRSVSPTASPKRSPRVGKVSFGDSSESSRPMRSGNLTSLQHQVSSKGRTPSQERTSGARGPEPKVRPGSKGLRAVGGQPAAKPT